MKKIILLIALAFSTFSTSQEQLQKFVKLTQSDIKFLEKTYNWNDEEFLLVNFRTPRGKCSYDNYEDLKSSMNWWKKFYRDIKLENVANRFVFSDSIRAGSILDSKTKFEDKNDFLLNEFFKEVETCYGVIILDKSGNYVYKIGEYLKQDIQILLEKIKSY